MPLAHLPGHAQVDFGEADGYIGGKLIRFIISALICRIRMAALLKLIPLKIPNPFWMGMLLHSRF